MIVARTELSGQSFSEVWSSFKEVRNAKACVRTHDNCRYSRLWRYCCECPSSRCPDSRHPAESHHPAHSGGPMQQQDQTRLQRRAQAGEQEDSDQDDFFRHHRGMMGGGMMGPGMMGGRMMGGMGSGHRDSPRGHDIFGPVMMRMMFSLMDADGDGKLSL